MNKNQQKIINIKKSEIKNNLIGNIKFENFFIENINIKYKIYNISFINESVILKNFIYLREKIEQINDNVVFIIPDKYKKNTIDMYINIIDYIFDENNDVENELYFKKGLIFLKNNNINAEFIDLLDYLQCDKMFDLVGHYININFNDLNEKMLNSLPYNITFLLYLNIEYKKLIPRLKYDSYFIGKWISRRIKGIIDISCDEIYNLNYDTYQPDKIFLSKYDNYEKKTYYDNKFIFDNIKNNLSQNESKYIENKLFKNIPIFIDINQNVIHDYNNIRGKFLQTTDNECVLKKRFDFNYNSLENNEQIIYTHLSIIQFDKEYIIGVFKNSNNDIFNNLNLINKNFINYTENKHDTKKIWDYFKDKIIFNKKNILKIQEIVNYMSAIN